MPTNLIEIATGLIDDECGRLLLVRKRGTEWFMQAGGKIEIGETPFSALQRELKEEIGLLIDEDQANYLGCFSAPAANEAECFVEAEVFHIRTHHEPTISLEIEEALWVTREEAEELPLAPLTRHYMIPLSQSIGMSA
ncbi:MAG: NUDIX domain-containing protein [Pseudomonadota bacterium]